jgi:hypothetical protein
MTQPVTGRCSMLVWRKFAGYSALPLCFFSSDLKIRFGDGSGWLS